MAFSYFLRMSAMTWQFKYIRAIFQATALHSVTDCSDAIFNDLFNLSISTMLKILFLKFVRIDATLWFDVEIE